MRRTFIAANWKMHTAPAGFDASDSPYRTHADMDVVVFPAATDIDRVRAAELLYGAQSGRPEGSGAFTGDLSVAMLADVGCRYILCGHSERRRHHGESDDFVMQQVIGCLEHGIHPVLCIGETKEEKTAGKTQDVLKKQLTSLPDDARILIAYEPVWAIGTGSAATPKEAQEAHAFIRSELPAHAQAETRILYGGSVDGKNAESFLAQEDVDGLLVGGASLDPLSFSEIISRARDAATGR